MVGGVVVARAATVAFDEGDGAELFHAAAGGLEILSRSFRSRSRML